ncbi:MAG: MarR family transcriptional regulator [Acidaminobacteraceae bacterium]
MYDQLKLENQICFRLYSSSRAITRLYQPLLDKIGLTYPQYLVMMVLWDRKSIPFRELMDVLQLKTGTLTPIVQRLEKAGYLEKKRDEKDDRKVDIILSKSGDKLREKAKEIPMRLLESMDMSLEEYTRYIKTLDEITLKLNL